jgi:hypothetical protein
MTTASDLRSTRKSQIRALLVAILIMLGIGGGTGWLVTRGLTRGETWFPSKRGARDRVVKRVQEPAMFWMAIAVYGVLCCGAMGAAGWLVREGMRATDGVFRGPMAHAKRDDAEERRSPHPLAQGETMTLDKARALIAGTRSAKERAAAEQLLNEALSLPQLAPSARDAALARIRGFDAIAPDYQLRSFGANVLEIVGDAHANLAVKKAIYAEAAELAARYASGASSGGEGAARAMHVREIEAKLQALEAPSRAMVSPSPTLSATAAVPPPQTPHVSTDSLPTVPPALSSTPRPAFLTALGRVFLIAGALATPISLISALMILAGGDGSSGGSFFGGLIVIAGPPATLIAGIGLLRRQHWAYGYAMTVLGVFAAHSLVQIIRGETPERSTVSPSGLITTTLASSPSYPLHLLIIAISLALLWKLRSPTIRAEFTR